MCGVTACEAIPLSSFVATRVACGVGATPALAVDVELKHRDDRRAEVAEGVGVVEVGVTTVQVSEEAEQRTGESEYHHGNYRAELKDVACKPVLANGKLCVVGGKGKCSTGSKCCVVPGEEKEERANCREVN